MPVSIEAAPAAAPALSDPIGLAYELGELPLDLRRRGIPARRIAGGIRIRKEGEEAADYEIRFASPAEALIRLSDGEAVRIVGLTLQYRRDAIVVREDSAKRTVGDLCGARLAVAGTGRFGDDGIRRREAARNVEIALGKAGLPPAVDWLEPGGAAIAGGFDASRYALPALLRGDIEAVYAEGALASEAGRLVGVRELDDFVAYSPELAILTASAELVRERPEWLARVLAHACLAASWAYGNRAEANRLAARQLGLPEDAVEAVFSERLHKQFGLSFADDKLSRLAHVKRELLADGTLRRDFPLDEATEPAGWLAAQRLIAEGEVEAPQGEPITRYADRDLPLSFFTDRAPAAVLAGDDEALAAARTFAEEIAPGASDRDRDRKLPLREMKRLAELGLLGLVVPKAYGGPDVRTRTLVDVFRIISRADGSLGQIPQNHHFFVKTVELVGTDEQKSFFFAEALKGAQFGNALAERGGKGGKRMTTTIRKKEEGYVLSGSKYYSTGALYAHWIPVTALDEEEKRMTAFVRRHAPGVTVVDDWSGIGQRTTASGSVVLRDAVVPAGQVLPHWQIFEGRNISPRSARSCTPRSTPASRAPPWRMRRRSSGSMRARRSAAGRPARPRSRT
ncbi:acyl-CoA dehydrogenase family protein [Paenibacillaceae bacterium WGS1546]|uniref:acyl-CoA dehydrogenase family protein n=1 Tax=Cohnella sp. WGS1546 TaxID=3366810 RepID=UPI00372D4ED3